MQDADVLIMRRLGAFTGDHIDLADICSTDLRGPHREFYLRLTDIVASLTKIQGGFEAVFISKRLQELADGIAKIPEGKRVAGVTWENILDRDTNPDGTIGHFVLHLADAQHPETF